MECIQLLQAHEYYVEHSVGVAILSCGSCDLCHYIQWQIIPLLTEAIGHFQKLGGVRMANHLSKWEILPYLAEVYLLACNNSTVVTLCPSQKCWLAWSIIIMVNMTRP